MLDTRSLQEPVKSYIRTDPVLFTADMDIEEVLGEIRKTNVSDQIAYFYVTDSAEKLVGVLPLRRLLSASPGQSVQEIMLTSVISVGESDTLAKANDLFSLHKFLSLPVLSQDGKMLGVLDITVLTGDSLDLTQKQRFDDVFETIGIRSSYLAYLTPVSSFKHRFPWLVPTLLSGCTCAVMAARYERTLSESIILAFFLTLILGLGESVSIQSLTITIRQLHIEQPTWLWYRTAVVREFLTALLLGISVGTVLAILVTAWRHSFRAGVAIGFSITVALLSASFFGLTIPALLHKTRLDPKVSAGPLVLGLADIFTLLFYFTIADWIL
jgi:magnesium transporter